jgi:hypothetical protein
MAESPTRPLEVYVSRKKILVLVLVSSVCLVFMFSGIAQGLPSLWPFQSSTAYLLKLVLYVALTAVALMATQKLTVLMQFLLKSQLLLSASEEGIHFPRLGLVHWSEIERIRPFDASRLLGLSLDRRLGIYLQDVEAFTQAHPHFKTSSQSLGGHPDVPHITLTGNLFAMRVDQLVDRLEALRNNTAAV